MKNKNVEDIFYERGPHVTKRVKNKFDDTFDFSGLASFITSKHNHKVKFGIELSSRSTLKLTQQNRTSRLTHCLIYIS